VPLPAPEISNSATAYPGGGYEADNLVDGLDDGSHRSEYASASKGTDTFIDFDFGRPTRIAAFRHVDRFDPATVDTADLLFSNDANFSGVLATVAVKHANTRGGLTFHPFTAVTARYVRWQVTAVKSYSTVGGSEISFFSSAEPEPAPVQTVVEPLGFPAVKQRNGEQTQPFRVTVRYPYAEPTEATLEVTGQAPVAIHLRPGRQAVDISLPTVKTETPVKMAVKVAGQVVAESQQTLEPVRPWVLYFLPHSHVDIGYTHVQTEVERKQWEYLEQAVKLAQQTADYPAGARFKWNSEGLWAVDSYLEQATPENREALLEAVRKGQIHLDALYGNELTGLCRPEELFRLVDCARRISRRYDLVIDSAMISDVPGYTWGIVPALAHSGVKYFSVGPNHVHRIGYTLADWGDRPFYWKSPSGEHKILFWMAGRAYSWFHNGLLGEIKGVDREPIFKYLNELSESGYPYDMVQLRYSIRGDNGPPDPNLPDFVKAWNAEYVHPKMVIVTTRQLFQEFEARYGDRIPEFRGDFTPYWEDGAGSSARETALARNASERLVRAEALWAMLDPRHYPADDFYAAWRNVLLYNEHTWGAHCSISQPDSQFTLDQWRIKQAFAVEAEADSEKLTASLLDAKKTGQEKVTAVDVYNTSSWPRTDLVKLTTDQPLAGDLVLDSQRRPVPSQRIASGRTDRRLAFLAKDVPPLGAKRFFLQSGEPHRSPAPQGGVKLAEGVLDNGTIRVTLDETTGAIGSLTVSGIPVDLADKANNRGLNEYWYVPGRNAKDAQRPESVEIHARDTGPLSASLVAISRQAPGSAMLGRIVRVIDGIDRVDVVNFMRKEKVLSKESVHFGFNFNVPGGVMRMDVPWAVVRPELDQLPGACKNYFSVGRWVDVSNDRFGVTWATVDAPLVEVGAITVDVLPSVFEPDNWIRRLEPTQSFYSYVMNNYWETNYKASQEDFVVFRYSIMPHRQFDSVAAARFGIERSQPLVAVPVDESAPVRDSLFRVEPESVMVSSLKPSEDGGAWIVRLFNSSDVSVKATLTWADPVPKRVWKSSPFEEEGTPLSGPIDLPGYGIATLRADLPE